MIVTIDGPAGAGKSTVAKRLADRLGFEYLDTGAMYRAVALAGLRAGVDWGDSPAMAGLARSLEIRVENRRTYLNGEDVTKLVRSVEVTAVTRYAADNPAVRERLVALQRDYAADRKVVTEGRDQGSAAFPNAECKLYVTATPEERARRRQGELRERGEDRPVDVLVEEINARDERDSRREVGPLTRPDDAIEIVTDGLSIDDVVDRLEAIVRERM